MSESRRRVCVTGGAGFIGVRLVSALLARGSEVVVLDDLSVGRRERVPGDARLVVYWKDIYELIEKGIDRCRDAGFVVFHVALKYS